jgi:competence protein ComEC
MARRRVRRHRGDAAVTPMRAFLLASLAGFAAGTALLQCAASLPPASLLALVGATWAVAAGRSRRPDALRAVGAFGAAMLLGAAVAAARAGWRLADELPPAWEGVDVAVTGVVDDLPQASARGVRFAFSVEAFEPVAARVPGRLSLSWLADLRGDAADEPPIVHAGERWRLTVRLKRPHGTFNPGGFDLEAWLLERNLRATGYVRPVTTNRRLDAFAGRPGDWIERARERLRERILAALAEAPYAGVIAALAIGDQRAIPEGQWTVFRRTGVTHLISISGLHITVFAALAGGVAFALARRSIRLTSRIPARKVAAVVGVAAAAAYTLLAGAEVPAQRTLIMLVVGACGLWLGRPGTASVVWLWALAIVLAIDPWAVLAPGFWLSFGAVGLLLYAGSGRRPPARSDRAWVRLRHALAEASRAQWVVTLGLVPFTLALFGQVSVIAPLANAVAIPVVTFGVVPLALAGLALPFDFPFVAAHAVFAPLMQGLEALGELPGSVWEQHAPPGWSVVAGVAGVLWLVAPRGVPGRPLGIAWLLPLVVVVPPAPAPGTFRLVAIDVGQGLAVLVQTHAHALVYDTGPRYHESADAGSRIVAPFLRVAGVGSLDALIVSHQDSDHSGGALSLLDTVPVGTLRSSLADDHEIVLRRGAAPGERCVAGQHWEWDGVRFLILHPSPADYANPRTKTNDLSCVLRVESAHGSALVTGDIEARSEQALLRAGAPLAADVLIVPHHGSRTSSTPAFVAAVAPSLAIFTPGYRNRFGHPRPEVVARYARSGAVLVRSDFDGAVSVEPGDGHTLRLRKARDEGRRYWHDLPQAGPALE